MCVMNDRNHETDPRKIMHRRIDAIGWGLFFIWIGIAVLADVGWGIGLIGVGVLILASWGAKEYLSGSIRSGASGARC